MGDKQFLDKIVASICTILCCLNLNHLFFDVSMSSLSSQGTYVLFHISNSLELSAYLFVARF